MSTTNRLESYFHFEIAQLDKWYHGYSKGQFGLKAKLLHVQLSMVEADQEGGIAADYNSHLLHRMLFPFPFL